MQNIINRFLYQMNKIILSTGFNPVINDEIRQENDSFRESLLLIMEYIDFEYSYKEDTFSLGTKCIRYLITTPKKSPTGKIKEDLYLINLIQVKVLKYMDLTNKLNLDMFFEYSLALVLLGLLYGKTGSNIGVLQILINNSISLYRPKENISTDYYNVDNYLIRIQNIFIADKYIYHDVKYLFDIDSPAFKYVSSLHPLSRIYPFEHSCAIVEYAFSFLYSHRGFSFLYSHQNHFARNNNQNHFARNYKKNLELIERSTDKNSRLFTLEIQDEYKEREIFHHIVNDINTTYDEKFIYINSMIDLAEKYNSHGQIIIVKESYILLYKLFNNEIILNNFSNFLVISQRYTSLGYNKLSLSILERVFLSLISREHIIIDRGYISDSSTINFNNINIAIKTIKTNCISLKDYDVFSSYVFHYIKKQSPPTIFLIDFLLDWADIIYAKKDFTKYANIIIKACQLMKGIIFHYKDTKKLLEMINVTIERLRGLINMGVPLEEKLIDFIIEFNSLGIRREIMIRQIKDENSLALNILELHKDIMKNEHHLDILYSEISYHQNHNDSKKISTINALIKNNHELKKIKKELEDQIHIDLSSLTIKSENIKFWLHAAQYQKKQEIEKASFDVKESRLLQTLKGFFASRIPEKSLYPDAVLMLIDTNSAKTPIDRGLFALFITSDEKPRYIPLPTDWLNSAQAHKGCRGFRLGASSQSQSNRFGFHYSFNDLHLLINWHLWSQLPLESYGHIHLIVQGKNVSTLPWQASLQLAYPSLQGKVSLHAGIALLPIDDKNNTLANTPAWPKDWRILGYGENYHYHPPLKDELRMACLEASLWRKHTKANTEIPPLNHTGDYVHQAGLNDPVAWVMCVHGDASIDFPHAARLKIAPPEKNKDYLEGKANAFIDVSSLMSHKQTPLWVYLSACVAGVMTEEITDPTGLPIGFLLNGTKLVIGSNQALDDVWACVLSALFLDRILTFKEREPEVQLQHIRLAFEQARSALLDGRLAIYNPDLRRDWQATLQQAQVDQSHYLHKPFLGMTDNIFHALNTIATLPVNAEFNLQTYNAVIEQQVTALQMRMLLSDTSRALLDNLGQRYANTIQHCQNHDEIREALQEVPIMGTDVVLMKDFITQLIDWTTPDYYKKDMRCPVPQEAIETAASMVVFG
jgi:hypothetical protein